MGSHSPPAFLILMGRQYSGALDGKTSEGNRGESPCRAETGHAVRRFLVRVKGSPNTSSNESPLRFLLWNH